MTNFKNFFQAKLTGLALAMVAAGAIGLSTPILAHQHGERGLERLTERLELTTEQADAISNLYSAHRDQMASIERRDQDGEPNRGAWRQMRESRQALHEEIQLLLNDEQAEQFKAMKRRGKGHGRNRGSHGGNLRGFALDDQQRSQLRELKNAQRESGQFSRQQFRQQVREILTEEQIAELDARRKSNRRAN